MESTRVTRFFHGAIESLKLCLNFNSTPSGPIALIRVKFVSVVVDMDLNMEESGLVCDSQEIVGIAASLLHPNGATQTLAAQVTSESPRIVPPSLAYQYAIQNAHMYGMPNPTHPHYVQNGFPRAPLFGQNHCMPQHRPMSQQSSSHAEVVVEIPSQNQARIDLPSHNQARVDPPSHHQARVDPPSHNKVNFDPPSHNQVRVDPSSSSQARVDPPSS
ncbi:hypothetical protein R1flu_024944 [Riccia fluitans]|uniref:Uncharacterized protein n=1 Tax=Riccia fluitans TaxID=41844 RepID=A0ABD1XWC2_9MARC